MQLNQADQLSLVGISHHVAPLTVRERLSVPESETGRTLSDLRTRAGATEALLLSTCNRTEYYCVGADPAMVRALAAARGGVPKLELEPMFYLKRGLATVEHAFAVACGLDSMILGEPEVLGQVKQAYRLACAGGHVDTFLSQLFERSFRVAKQIRSQTAIGLASLSAPALCVKVARSIFEDLRDCSVLCIGAGTVISAAVEHMRGCGVKRLVLASRSAPRAADLAARNQVVALSLEAALAEMEHYDIIVTATSSTIPILGKGLFEKTLVKRRHRPIAIFDLAVPRDVEPETVELDDIFLHTIDDMGRLAGENRRQREDAAGAAWSLVASASRDFADWLGSRDASAAIGQLRARIDRLRDIEANRALAAIERGDEPAAQVRLLAHRLAARLAHEPVRAVAAMRSQPEVAAEICGWYDDDDRSAAGSTKAGSQE